MTGPGRWRPWGGELGKRELEQRELERRELERRLQAALERLDPMPEHVAERARAAGRPPWPAGSELLGLVYDSIVDPNLRELETDERTRLLDFAGDGVRLVVRLEIVSGTIQLCAWTAPVQAVAMKLLTEHGETDLVVESHGTMVARPVEREASCLLVALETVGGVRSFHTSWFTP